MNDKICKSPWTSLGNNLLTEPNFYVRRLIRIRKEVSLALEVIKKQGLPCQGEFCNLDEVLELKPPVAGHCYVTVVRNTAGVVDIQFSTLLFNSDESFFNTPADECPSI